MTCVGGPQASGSHVLPSQYPSIGRLHHATFLLSLGNSSETGLGPMRGTQPQPQLLTPPLHTGASPLRLAALLSELGTYAPGKKE